MQMLAIMHGSHEPQNMPFGICSCYTQHFKFVQKLLYSSLCVQRQDSRAEARALQEQFLQQAKADLEAFQQNCCAAAAAHHLDSGASPDGTPPADGAAGVQAAQQPPSSRPAEGTRTTADGAAYRCAQELPLLIMLQWELHGCQFLSACSYCISKSGAFSLSSSCFTLVCFLKGLSLALLCVWVHRVVHGFLSVSQQSMLL